MPVSCSTSRAPGRSAITCPAPCFLRNSAALPLLGLVRNPWSYYVSWYSFQRSRPRPNALFQTLSNGGALDFAGTIRNMLNLDRDRGAAGSSARRPAGDVHQSRIEFAERRRWRRFAAADWASIRFCIVICTGRTSTAVKLARMEQLRVEAPQLLETVGEPVTPALRDSMSSAPALNTSEHAPHRQLYDAELAQLVAERDRLVIERHGYTFQ